MREVHSVDSALLNNLVVIRISLAHRRPCLCTYSAGGDGRTYAHVCHSMAPSSRYCGGWVASRDTGHDYDLGSRHSAPEERERARLGVRLPKSLTSINTPPLTRGKTMHVLAVKDGAHSIARTTHKRQTLTLSACGPAQTRCSRVAIFGRHRTGQCPQHSPHLLCRSATNSTAVSNRSQKSLYSYTA